MRPPTIQQQYLANWHDSFVNYVSQILAAIASAELSSQATEEDKRGPLPPQPVTDRAEP